MTHPTLLPAPLYKGSVNSWECDDGGHLNVRFHLERALIGLAHLAHQLEMPRAFTKAAGATLVPREAHIRFLKEARAGAPLVMHGGVLKLDECEAHICLDMRHGDGGPASAFTLRVAHADTRGFQAFAWSQRSRAAAARLVCKAPAHAIARSLQSRGAASTPSIARAAELGAERIGASLVMPDQCDCFGRLRGEHLLGRVSDAVPNFLAGWRVEMAADAAAQGVEIVPAGAVVEARLRFCAWPRAGDLIEIHSGVAEINEKTMRLCHWILDPERGGAWAAFEVIALTFDTLTRKTIAPSPALLRRMREGVIDITL
ncbi:MAG: thioesterase family protein [Terricaulis sp.]